MPWVNDDATGSAAFQAALFWFIREMRTWFHSVADIEQENDRSNSGFSLPQRGYVI